MKTTYTQVEEMFSKMTAYYYSMMPNNIEEIEAMTLIYFEKLKEYEYSLVLQNFDKHIETSRFLPTISDLVKQPKKETEGNPYIPNLQETKAMMALEYTPEPASKEFVEQKKKEIERILEEGRKKHEQRVAAVFEQQRI